MFVIFVFVRFAFVCSVTTRLVVVFLSQMLEHLLLTDPESKYRAFVFFLVFLSPFLVFSPLINADMKLE